MELLNWEPDLRTVIDRIDAGDIDLQPDFQRQEIWQPKKKKKLVDSVLREWSIPPIFLVVSSEGKMEVLDGQQRLAALRDFFDNRISVDGTITPRDLRIAELHGQFYKDLSTSDRRRVDQYTLRCVRITNYEPDEPSELFYRLNQPSTLTAGEQRNAFYGPAREQLKELVSDFEQLGNSSETIGFSNSRLAYDDIVARILFFVERGTFAIRSSESVISARFRSKEEFSFQVFETTRRAIRRFSEARAERDGGRLKLNKASALSWLLFFTRYSGGDSDLAFMRWFAEARDFSYDERALVAAKDLFQDRASLRVTDVSSVVYRDFCLWLALYIGSGGKSSLFEHVRSDLLEDAKAFVEIHTEDEQPLDTFLQSRVNLQEWANLA